MLCVTATLLRIFASSSLFTETTDHNELGVGAPTEMQLGWCGADVFTPPIILDDACEKPPPTKKRRAPGQSPGLFQFFSESGSNEFDLDVDARRQIEPLQRVNRLRRRIQDVE